jgi:HSP20 family protein
MAVFRWGNAWEAFEDLEREVDRVLQGVNLQIQGVRVGRPFPAVNLYELPGEFLLTAEIPGTRREDLELTIAGGVLTIKGKRSQPEGVPEERFRRQERFRGAWQRSMTLPERVQDEALSAELSNGVLRIHLPKAPDVRPRQIAVVEGGE